MKTKQERKQQIKRKIIDFLWSILFLCGAYLFYINREVLLSHLICILVGIMWRNIGDNK